MRRVLASTFAALSLIVIAAHAAPPQSAILERSDTDGAGAPAEVYDFEPTFIEPGLEVHTDDAARELNPPAFIEVSEPLVISAS